MLKFNGKVMKFGNVWGAAGSVTPPAPADEVRIGNQIWKTAYLNIDDGQGGIDYVNSHGYSIEDELPLYTYEAATRIANTNYPGWRVAQAEDYYAICSAFSITAAKYSDLFATEYGGNDTLGLKLRPYPGIYLNSDGSFFACRGYTTITISTDSNKCCLYADYGTDHYFGYARSESVRYPTVFVAKLGGSKAQTIVRLVKDA